jgi:SAM-dependent methyltransferase
MFSYPYKGIPQEIRDVIESLLDPHDEYHQGHKRRLARTLQVFLDQNPEGRVLELGTEGFFPLALKKLRPDLDISVTNFDFKQDTTHKYVATMREDSEEFTAYAVDLESDEIPEKSNTFDWILCCEVLEHMDVDPMFMMSEINRLAKPGGGLLLTTPNVASSWGIAKILKGIEPYFYMQYHKDRSPYRHNYEYSVYSVGKIVKSAGFSGSAWTENTFEDPYMVVVDKLTSLGFRIENTGDNIFAVAHKSSGVVDRYPEGLYA